jgi:hypothetical protein
MPEYLVKVARLVTADFTIDAEDEADAKARYREGQEIASRVDKQVAYKVTLRGD